MSDARTAADSCQIDITLVAVGTAKNVSLPQYWKPSSALLMASVWSYGIVVVDDTSRDKSVVKIREYINAHPDGARPRDRCPRLTAASNRRKMHLRTNLLEIPVPHASLSKPKGLVKTPSDPASINLFFKPIAGGVECLSVVVRSNISMST
jgi:hypothetical protein